MSEHFKTESITVEGQEFEVRFYYDCDHGRPWSEEDGHGPVRSVHGSGDKRPGERLMQSADSRGRVWAYDVQEATKQAHRDGWGLAPAVLQALVVRLGRQPTVKQVRAEAVRLDYERMNGWVSGDWHWMGVGVLPLDDDGEPDESTEYEYAIWGVESDGDYWREVAKDCASDYLHVQKQAADKAAAEAVERAYWAARGVLTVGE